MAGLNSVGFSNSDDEVDLEGLWARLRKMSDAEPQRDIQAGEDLCSPRAKFGKPPRQVFVIQLAEARAEREPPRLRKGTQEMTRHGGHTNANRAHHSHNPHNNLGLTTPASLVE